MSIQRGIGLQRAEAAAKGEVLLDPHATLIRQHQNRLFEKDRLELIEGRVIQGLAE